MIMEDEALIKAYLQQYEQKLEEALTAVCREAKALPQEGPLPYTEDLVEKWKEIAPEYMADAVPQIAEYPEVSVAWAAYLGMAWANVWHSDWKHEKKREYKSFYGPRAFDDMDEHILFEELGLQKGSEAHHFIESLILKLSSLAVTLIRREQIEPQSVLAFHVFARCTKVMFLMGAALRLTQLGYSMQKA